MLTEQEQTTKSYLQLLKNKGKSQATQKRFHFWLTKLAEHISKPFEEMTAEDIGKYIRTLKEKSVVTRNTIRQTLGKFFKEFIKNPEILLELLGCW